MTVPCLMVSVKRLQPVPMMESLTVDAGVTERSFLAEEMDHCWLCMYRV